jgi:hypothetical protein
VVAGEDSYDRPHRDRRRTDPCDRRKPLTDGFQAAESAGRLRQAVLTVAGGLGRVDIDRNETPEGVGERAQ